MLNILIIYDWLQMHDNQESVIRIVGVWLLNPKWCIAQTNFRFFFPMQHINIYVTHQKVFWINLNEYKWSSIVLSSCPCQKYPWWIMSFIIRATCLPERMAVGQSVWPNYTIVTFHQYTHSVICTCCRTWAIYLGKSSTCCTV